MSLSKAIRELKKRKPLGRSITIPATAPISSADSVTVFMTDVHEIVIGIGKDEYATLYISKDALKALRNGEKIDIDSKS